MICKPTRIQNQSAIIIDNIFCNEIMTNRIISGIFLTDISDHFPIFSLIMDTKLKTVKTTQKIRDFSEKNIVRFQNILSNFNWQSIIEVTKCQEAFTIFYKNFRNMFDQSFYNVKVKRSPYHSHKCWLSSGIRNSIKTKNKLYIKYKRNNTDKNRQAYKTYRNKVNSMIRLAEKQ